MQAKIRLPSRRFVFKEHQCLFLLSQELYLQPGSSALVDASGAPTALGFVLSEFFGTFILILLGAGVCAAVTLKKSYAKDAGWVVITFGWGLAVFTAVYLSFHSGAHLSPAVTVGLATAGRDLATGVPANPAEHHPVHRRSGSGRNGWCNRSLPGLQEALR